MATKPQRMKYWSAEEEDGKPHENGWKHTRISAWKYIKGKLRGKRYYISS